MSGAMACSHSIELAPEAQDFICEERVLHFVDQVNAIFNGASIDTADEIFTSIFIGHAPLAPRLDRQGWKAYINAFYTAIPDLGQEVNEVIIGEDRIALYVTYTGTHRGMFLGVLGTGKSVSFDGMSIFRFDDTGQVTENWMVIDITGLLAQLSAFFPAINRLRVTIN
jgi:steroid delta-isomerase-like uncharacterized protein